MNVELLEKVKQHILEEPKRFDMEFIRTPRSQAPCGTTCCIAGWLLKLDNPALAPDVHYWQHPKGYSLGSDTAAELLGIDFDLANPLFDFTEWPQVLCTAYADAETDADRAKAGADAIDAFIAADGEWQ